MRTASCKHMAHTLQSSPVFQGRGEAFLQARVCGMKLCGVSCIKHIHNRLQFPVCICLKCSESVSHLQSNLSLEFQKFMDFPLFFHGCVFHVWLIQFPPASSLYRVFLRIQKLCLCKINSPSRTHFIAFRNWLNHTITIANTMALTGLGK